MARIPRHTADDAPEASRELLAELVQCRIVSDPVGPLAAFYAELAGVAVTLNEYYVEVPAGAVSVGFSRPG